MYLIFALGRPDVFTLGDAAIIGAIRKLYSLPEKKWQHEAEWIAQKWRPHRTLACRYLWKYHGGPDHEKDQ